MLKLRLHNKHWCLLLLIVTVLVAPLLAEGIPEMSGTDHVIQRDVFGSSGMVGKSGAIYQVHDALGQPSPVFRPDSSIGTDNYVIVGFLPPEDNTPPVSWIWTEYEYTPDTMVVLHWAGHDSANGVIGSGIYMFDIQYRQDGGAWIHWTSSFDTTGVFGPCNMGSEYDFRVRAVDFANNVEEWTTDPDSFANTTIDYLVDFDIDIFAGGLPLDPTNSIRYTHYDTIPTDISTDSTWDNAAVWCIPGTHLIFNSLSTESDGLERWITLEDTVWFIDSRTNLTITYYHQFWADITMFGTDPTHRATLENHDQFGLTYSGTLHFNNFSTWADRNGTLRMSEFTDGTPPRQTYDTREWSPVVAPINDTIWYGFAPVEIKNAFGTSDTGVIVVDGDTVDSPFQAHWPVGTMHSVRAVTPQLQTMDERYAFQAWSDGGELFHFIEHTAEVDTYVAYFTIEYPLRIFKYPEQPYGWIAFEDDTAWGASEHTFWAQPVGPYEIAVSEVDIYSDSIWTFDHWGDYIYSSSRMTNLFEARDLIAVYNADTWSGELSFEFSDTTWDAGNLNYSETRCMNDYEGIYVENTGDVTIDWGLWIRDDGPIWSASFLPGPDTYTLRARFTRNFYAPECIEYNAVDDWVDYNLTWATDETFGPEGWGISPTGMNWAMLWFYFKSPTRSTHGTTTQTIEVGILGKVVLP